MKIKVSDLKEHFNSSDWSSFLDDALNYGQQHRKWSFWSCCICKNKLFIPDENLYREIFGLLLPEVDGNLWAEADDSYTDRAYILDKITFSEDSSFLVLDEDLVVDSDALLSWIFTEASADEHMVSWEQARLEKVDQVLGYLKMFKAEFDNMLVPYKQKCQWSSYNSKLRSIKELCSDKDQSFDALLRERLKQIKRSVDLDTDMKLELAVITDALEGGNKLVFYPDMVSSSHADTTSNQGGDGVEHDDVDALNIAIKDKMEKMKQHAFDKIKKANTSMMKIYAGMQRLAFLLQCTCFSDFRAALIPVVKSFLQEHLEDHEPITYLTQQQAIEIGNLLMDDVGLTIDQIMELNGLSVASSISELEVLSIPSVSIESLPKELLNFDILVDAIFGFSFKGNPRPPFDDLISSLASLNGRNKENQKTPVIVSVDIPSGWHVEDGDATGTGIKPDMLVSLTAPKVCAKTFSGAHHFLGGRCVPSSVIDKYKLHLPPYADNSMCVLIRTPSQCPFVQFQKWYDNAVTAGVKEADAMTLLTARKDGKPSSRMISLKNFGQGGFAWCSNHGSREGRELSENPQASLLFYWNAINCQVTVEGLVEKVSNEEYEQYLSIRPRDIQIAPAMSKESNVISGGEVLKQRCKELEKYSEGPNWGGYRLTPESFEFCQGDALSVHTRLQYFAQHIDGRKAWKIIQF